MSVNDQKASNWWIGTANAKKKNATRNVQLSLPIETRIFEHPMHIYMYFDDIFQESSKQSRLTQSEPS